MSKLEFRDIKKGKTPLEEAQSVYLQTSSAQINIPANITIPGLRAKLKAERQEDIRYQSRRWGQWEENYFLHRDTVEINRLTQRQAVNIPLVKETTKTVMSKLQDEPTLTYQDRGGDEDKEIAVNEFYRDDAERQRLDLLDPVDKKQVILYGRSHTKHNFKNGRWTYEVKDIRDVVVDKKTKPHDIQSARHIEELNIWKPLAEIIVNDAYDAVARQGLAMAAGAYGDDPAAGDRAHNPVLGKTEEGIQRDERMLGMGVDIELLDESAYESMAQLTQHYTNLWDKEKKKYVRYVILTVGTEIDWILRAEPLKDALGIDEWPFDTWADDLEATDYWSDGIIDSIRAINQTINIWFSQLIENRTLRNFGMNFYDATADDGFTPAGFEPRAGGWYPLPGKPSEVYQNVEIQDLGSVIEDIQFLVSLAEKASATGAIDKGVVEQGKRTLGEIEIAVSKAMERTTAMSKYYKRARKDMGIKWYSINDANVTGSIQLYKQNSQGKLKGASLKRENWTSELGYEITVESISEQITERTDELIRLQAVKQFFPVNPPLESAIKRRALMIGKLTPEEITDIMDFDKEQQKLAQEAEAKKASMDEMGGMADIMQKMGMGAGAPAAPAPAGGAPVAEAMPIPEPTPAAPTA